MWSNIFISESVGGIEECVDKRSDCVGVLYYCPIMKGQCDKTCGFCGKSLIHYDTWLILESSDV